MYMYEGTGPKGLDPLSWGVEQMEIVQFACRRVQGLGGSIIGLCGQG
jgi:hypothetical protein